jgi:endonuclease-3 related protein
VNCPDGGTGRHAILRGWWANACASSSLAPGTNQEKRQGSSGPAVFHLVTSSFDERPATRNREQTVNMRAEPLRALYERLLKAFGPQGWWPGEGPFEIMVGAVLTQGTAWTNAARAIERLREAGVLAPEAMERTATTELSGLVRPAGFHRRKTRTLAALAADIARRDGGLRGYLNSPRDALRRRLLAIEGIGPETADAMMAYAARLPVFVVDAYTRRVAGRHGILAGTESYDDVQSLFERSLPRDARLMAELHALIVRVAKEHCTRTEPRCGGCPLESYRYEPGERRGENGTS